MFQSFMVHKFVGAEGLEPSTSCSQSRHASQLRYAPNGCIVPDRAGIMSEDSKKIWYRLLTANYSIILVVWMCFFVLFLDFISFSPQLIRIMSLGALIQSSLLIGWISMSVNLFEFNYCIQDNLHHRKLFSARSQYIVLVS